MLSKKIYIVISLLAILIIAAVVFKLQNNKPKNIYSPDTHQGKDSIVVVTTTPTSNTFQPTPLTSVKDIGSLTPSDNRQAQLYKNLYLGIQITIQKNWILEDIYDKNFINFKDPIDAEINYQKNKQQLSQQGITAENWVHDSQTLEIKHYNDFSSWLKADDTARPSDCTSIKECFQNDPAFTIHEISAGGVSSLDVCTSGTEGEMYGCSTFIEHNGVYQLDYVSSAIVPYDFVGVVQSLKFLN